MRYSSTGGIEPPVPDPPPAPPLQGGVSTLDPRPNSCIGPAPLQGLAPGAYVRDRWWSLLLNLQPRRGRAFAAPADFARCREAGACLRLEPPPLTDNEPARAALRPGTVKEV